MIKKFKKSKRFVPIVLSLIVLLALLLRMLPLFYSAPQNYLNYSSTIEEENFFGRYIEKKVMWYGEASSVFVASQNLKEMTKLLSYNVHPPFYYLTLHFWIKLFGLREITVSFLSIIFNLLAIIAIYFLGKEIFKNKNYGLATALILALIPFQVLFATRVTEQSLAFLLAILSCIFLWKTINNFEKKNILFYVFFTTLMIYTSYPAFFLWLSQIVYITFHNFKYKKRQLKKWILIQALILLLFIPQLLTVKSWAFFSGFEGLLHWQRRLKLSIFSSLFTLPGDLIAVNSQDINSLINIIFWLIIILFLIKFKKNKPEKNYLVFLLVSTILILFIFKFYNTVRYFFVISFLWYIILTFVTYKKKIVFALLIILLLFLNYKSFLTLQNSEDYGRDFAKYIKNNEQVNDLIVGDKIVLNYYYTRKENGELPIYWFLGLPEKFEDNIYNKILFFGYNTVKLENLNQLARVIQPYDRIWFIQSRDLSLNDPLNLTLGWLNYNFELINFYPVTPKGVINYYDAYIFLFQK